MLRRAAHAGSFYPEDAGELRTVLSSWIRGRPCPQKAQAVVVPHAAYQFCGQIAAETLSAVRLPRRFIVLCPNHVGTGAPISIQSRGRWETPLGSIRIDRALGTSIRRHCLNVQECPRAHKTEHAIEVLLPILQALLEDAFTFVPISVGTSRLDSLLKLGDRLARAVRESDEPVLIVASSDLSHFESAEVIRRKDELAIDCIRRLDPRDLFDCVSNRGVTMCGFGAAIAMMQAAAQLGSSQGSLIGYGHSGQVTGDDSNVVGYAGMTIH